MHNDSTRPPGVPILVAALVGLALLFHLGLAIQGRPIFRATFLGTALEFADNKIDWLNPVIVGFNAKGTPSALEFPIWQGLVAAVFKMTGSRWYGWSNLVSFGCFLTCLWPLLQLGRRYMGERAAWWGLAFFAAQPLIVVTSGQGSGDGLAMVLSIWFLFFAEQTVRTGNLLFLVGAVVFGALSATTKLPFFMAAACCSVGLGVLGGIRSVKNWVLLAIAGLASGGAFLGWTAHTNALAAGNEFPYVELRLSQSRFIRFWYFGDLAYRLNPAHWVKAGWRFAHAMLGSLPMLLLLIVALARRGLGMPKIWLACTALVTLVFTHLVLEHWHYYLMCSPAVALLCAGLLARWEAGSAKRPARPFLKTAIVGCVLCLSAVEGILAMKISIDLDPFPKQMAQVIEGKTTPSDKLLLYQCDPNWGGEVLFRAHRKGLSVISDRAFPGGPSPKGLLDILESPADIARLKTLGYTKLVMISESPVRWAVEASNPGKTRERRTYPQELPGVAGSWPVDYSSPDLVIRSIP